MYARRGILLACSLTLLGCPGPSSPAAPGGEPGQRFDKVFGRYQHMDWATDIVATSDGGYGIVGAAEPFQTKRCRLRVMKLDATGARSWQKSFGGDSTYDTGYGIAAAPDGGLLAVGYKRTPQNGDDVWAVRLDEDGELVWEKTFGGAKLDGAYAVLARPDGTYVLVGDTTSKGAGKLDAWVLAISDAGELLWDTTYGGAERDVFLAVTEAGDGFAVAGYTKSSGAGGSDAWVLRLDAKGGKVWESTIGGKLGERAFGVCATADGGVLVVGEAQRGAKTDWDAFVACLDNSGKLLWEQRWGQQGSKNHDVLRDVIRTQDGNYAAAGYRDFPQDIWILGLDPKGERLWEQLQSGRGSSHRANALLESADGDLVVAGKKGQFNSNYPDTWVAKLAPGAPAEKKKKPTAKDATEKKKTD